MKWAEKARPGYWPQDPVDEFKGDEPKKSVKVISGGEAQRMLIGKLVLGMPNVMLLDESTNYLDMESIESLATRILELKPGDKPGSAATVVDFRGSYEDYLESESTALAA